MHKAPRPRRCGDESAAAMNSRALCHRVGHRVVSLVPGFYIIQVDQRRYENNNAFLNTFLT